MTAVSAEMTRTIQAELQDIAAADNVLVLLGIESGSRAWGFHSPDSDYDVRFIYAEPVEWHLSLDKKRDVIERPIDAILDVSGWSLAKTLKLIMTGNAVAAEWLQSPICYDQAPGFRETLVDFAQDAMQRRPTTWHYSALCHNQLKRCYDEDGKLRLKKFFYALRPALAMRWMRENDAPMPPMDMAALRAGCDLAETLSEQIDELTVLKANAREVGTADISFPDIEMLIKEELWAAENWLKLSTDQPPKEGLHDRANAIHAQFCRMAGDNHKI